MDDSRGATSPPSPPPASNSGNEDDDTCVQANCVPRTLADAPHAPAHSTPASFKSLSTLIDTVALRKHARMVGCPMIPNDVPVCSCSIYYIRTDDDTPVKLYWPPPTAAPAELKSGTCCTMHLHACMQCPPLATGQPTHPMCGPCRSSCMHARACPHAGLIVQVTGYLNTQNATITVYELEVLQGVRVRHCLR